ncbi:hypothetical protein CYY_003175 [Polysphondylium violaceum]|uniref:FNIP repeat-containing protein n=1 Tax=Polysphondylium violaceum TaxID=133409 RepID=A0A8J4Q079_9MYCE|nr:hypothetical protein CYY_003175 [Polysphondylium violaceum]
MTIDNSFYSIWRNRFLSSQIRKQVFDSLDIMVDLQDLVANKQYLARLSNEKISLKLGIKSKEHFIEFLDHSERYLITDLEIDPKVEICRWPKLKEQEQQPDLIRFDCSLIPDTVTKVTFWVEEGIMGYGKLPNSITELGIQYSGISWHNFSSRFLDQVLANLPQQLVSLTLPNSCDIRNQVVLPNSLCELKYTSTYDNLKKLVVPPSVKVYDMCTIQINDEQGLEWLRDNTWINRVVLNDVSCIITTNLIPSHVVALSLSHNHTLEIGALPAQLQSLVCMYHLPLVRGIVPPKLKYLYVDEFNEKLERNVLPDTLKTLRISSFNQPLEPRVLPINLKSLTLDSFNKQLEPDVLPPSLNELYLNSYNKPLNPYVLPQSLTKLQMYDFNHPLQASSLPASLTHLTMDSFCQSLEHVGSLPNLRNVFIAQIDQYISNLLVNVKDVSLTFQEMTTSAQPVSLSNTSIEKLVIKSVAQTITIDSGFLPRTLTDLSMTRLAVASSNVIPEGCLFLKTDIDDLNPEFLPKSIITKKSIN